MLRSRRAGVRVVGIVLLLVLACAPARAQRATSRVAEPAVPEKAGKELVAHYVGDTPPRIDGDLDDEIWQQAQAIDDMVQNDPNNMEPPTERTVVKVAYDDRSVYVAVMNFMRDPSRITTALGRRDTNPRSDSIKITFDPRHDHLTAYTFDCESRRRAGRHDVVRRHAHEHRLRRGVGSAHAGRRRRLDARSFAFRSRSCASASPRASRWCGASTSAATSSTTPR